MRNSAKIFSGLLLTFLMTQSYAFTVKVHSNDSNITGLGFTKNGEKHGGAGTDYSADDMTRGSYSFGLRANGKDIGCPVNGRRTIKLSRDTSVELALRGKHCVATVQ